MIAARAGKEAVNASLMTQCCVRLGIGCGIGQRQSGWLGESHQMLDTANIGIQRLQDLFNQLKTRVARRCSGKVSFIALLVCGEKVEADDFRPI